MSDNTSTTNSNTSTPSKAPTHTAYQVRDGKNGKSFWTKMAASLAARRRAGVQPPAGVRPLGRPRHAPHHQRKA